MRFGSRPQSATGQGDLYPDPPHLSAFVAPDMDQWEALGVAWDVLIGAGRVFVGDVLVACEHRWFRDVSDVEREVVRSSGSARDLLARGDVLRVQFRHRSIGTVALGLASADEFGQPHPLEIAVHAGALSLPVEIWSKADRQAAKRVMGWMERLLITVAGPTRARYGAIGIESRLPSPASLARAQRSPYWPTTWFWSSQIGADDEVEQEQLLSKLSQSALSRTKEGTLFRAWRPWSDPRIDVPGLEQVASFLVRAVGPLN